MSTLPSVQIGASTWLWTSPLTTAAAENLLPRIAQLGFALKVLMFEQRRLDRLGK